MTSTGTLEGYRHRDSGEVVVLGRDPWRAPPSCRARVGIVLQDTGAVPDLSVTELVRYFRTCSPTHVARQRSSTSSG